MRNIISGLISGVIGGLIISFSIQYIESILLARGIGLIVFGILLATAVFRSSFYGRKAWLKVLNGKLEGMEIPAPSHLAGMFSGGGINTMFSSNMLANSDFFTGAFPA